MVQSVFDTTGGSNIWQTDFLEDNPAFAYQAFRPERGISYEGAPRSFFDYFRNRQSQMEQEYVAQQGRLARTGQPPSGTNVAFLSQFPWMERWLSLTPQQRGVRSPQSLQWMIPR